VSEEPYFITLWILPA